MPCLATITITARIVVNTNDQDRAANAIQRIDFDSIPPDDIDIEIEPIADEFAASAVATSNWHHRKMRGKML